MGGEKKRNSKKCWVSSSMIDRSIGIGQKEMANWQNKKGVMRVLDG